MRGQRGEVCGEGRDELGRCSRARVEDTKPVRVQALPRMHEANAVLLGEVLAFDEAKEVRFVEAVHLVPDDGKPRVVGVDADLVESPGAGPGAEEAVFRSTRQDLEVGSSRATRPLGDHPDGLPDPGSQARSEGGVDEELIALWSSVDQEKVLLLCAPALELRGESRGDLPALTEDDDPAGLPVEAMDDLDSGAIESLPPEFEEMGEEGVPEVPTRGMNREVAWFIDDEQVSILIEDLDVERHRRLGSRLGLVVDAGPGPDEAPGAGRCSVDEDAARLDDVHPLGSGPVGKPRGEIPIQPIFPTRGRDDVRAMADPPGLIAGANPELPVGMFFASHHLSFLSVSSSGSRRFPARLAGPTEPELAPNGRTRSRRPGRLTGGRRDAASSPGERPVRNRFGREDITEGIVVRVRPRKVSVLLEGGWEPAFLRGTLATGPRRATHVVAVGDRVRMRRSEGRNVIEEVLPRRNAISRVDPGSTTRDIEHVLAANLDWLLVVVSLARPRLNFRGLDRLLVLGEISEVPCVVLLNKDDLAEPYDPTPEAVYAGTGYRLIRTSARTGAGIDEVRDVLRGRVSLLAGASGVGKSSLLNTLFPGLDLPTQPVSSATGKGVHTTTRVEWVDLPGGGAILDSPGVRSIQPFGLHQENLELCFPEFERLRGSCQFGDCRHRDEPGCAIRAAVARGEIAAGRYDSYSRILFGVDKPDWWRRSMGG